MVLCGIWASVVGSNRGGSAVWWFVAGFFLGVIGVALAYLCTGKRCPACQKRVSHQATLCPYCMTRQMPTTQKLHITDQMNDEEREIAKTDQMKAVAACLIRLKTEHEA
jgi:RNA polymerase subunit RPABC4/transcription elongation factor Spt4